MNALRFMKHRLDVAHSSSGEGRATPIVLKWLDYTDATRDETYHSLNSGTATLMSGVVNGVVHVVGATTSLRQWSEIQTGDAIIDFAPDVDLSGKEGLRFEFGGKLWAQKNIPDQLVAAWDVIERGETFEQTIVVSIAT